MFLQLPVKEKLIFLDVRTENGVPHLEELGRQLMMPGSQPKITLVGVGS